MDGTSLDALRSKKFPSNNTTGYKGVYKIRGKYMAKIVFQKKQFFLGTFEKIEDAAEARKQAEALLYEKAIDFYDRWKARAKGNPICFDVQKDESGKLQVQLPPIMD